MKIRKVAALILGLALAGVAVPAHADDTTPDPTMPTWCAAPTWSYTGPPRWERNAQAAVDIAESLTGITINEADPATADITFKVGPLPKPYYGMTNAFIDSDNHIESAPITIAPRAIRDVRWSPVHSRDRKMNMIMLHELGHALGLQHIDSPHHVMSAMLGVQHVTPEDVAAFATVHIDDMCMTTIPLN